MRLVAIHPESSAMSMQAESNYAFAPVVPCISVAGSSQRFPVRRVYCVGRNYAEHAREMGHDPEREPPFFFMKTADSLLQNGSVFPYPQASHDVHHEIELVVAIGHGGSDITENSAMGHVWGYAVGLDMTRRDLQGQAKKLGRPWEVGKAFDAAAPCSALQPAHGTALAGNAAIWLEVNGQERQRGQLKDMIWSVPEIIAHLSGLFRLEAGDLIFTGTPAGVGPVQRGDRMHGGIEGVGVLDITVGH
jgi:fumarylpyruvate hydrolase